MSNASEWIGVDWGTSRFRAYRLKGETVLERVEAADGMASVPPGGFAAVLERHCGGWMREAPQAPVWMAGMVGARNGWAEAPYAPCPASAKSLSAARLAIDARLAIVPGVIARAKDGADVMRGEETLIIGTQVVDGLVCLPGTHSKWARVAEGAICDFSTFMTGESYALYRHQSLLSRLAEEPEEKAFFKNGLAAARHPAGLLNRLFQARSLVLDAAMPGRGVGPYLSGLLIGTEIQGAFARYGRPKSVTLVADGGLAESYGRALEDEGLAARTLSPDEAFLAGLALLRKEVVP